MASTASKLYHEKTESSDENSVSHPPLPHQLTRYNTMSDTMMTISSGSFLFACGAFFFSVDASIATIVYVTLPTFILSIITAK